MIWQAIQRWTRKSSVYLSSQLTSMLTAVLWLHRDLALGTVSMQIAALKSYNDTNLFAAV
jgi:hypothetical protein